MPSRPAPHVAVLGAGAFGGWTALALVERGARVTLVDPWGAGSSRASSGGESRLIRAVYGDAALYVEWTIASLERWRRFRGSDGGGFLTETGLLWLVGGEGAGHGAYLEASRPLLAAAGWPLASVPLAEAARRWPGVCLDGIAEVAWEPRAGVLAAREATRSVAAAVAAGGGVLLRAAALPPVAREGRLGVVELSDGSRLAADAFVFAAGPWLPELFPRWLGRSLQVSRQQVVFLGPPAASAAALEALPPFLELGPRIVYGMPDGEGRGFKIADDTRGPAFDPSTGDRRPDPAWTRRVRRWAAGRFPALAGAPVVETRVCQYTNTPDGDLLLGPHPTLADVWVAGGGCGHGFKLGPAVGEQMAALVLDGASPPPEVATARTQAWNPGERRTQFSHRDASGWLD